MNRINDERVTSHNWRTNRKIDKQAKKGGFLWFALIKTVMNGWRWSKEEVKPQFQMGFLVICHHLWLKKKSCCCSKNTKESNLSAVPETYERTVALRFACFFVFLSPKCWNYNVKTDSIDQSQQHGTLIYFVIICRQNVHPLGQQLTCTHYRGPQSSFIFLHPPRRNSAFSHDELCKSSTDDWKALIGT